VSEILRVGTEVIDTISNIVSVIVLARAIAARVRNRLGRR
jgi:hypothetical protein